MTAKKWLADHEINDKSYYYWLRRVRLKAYAEMEMELPAVAENEMLL